jgi:class 3 adenylate cyclase/tetratricopeptide (TPR) repeat protein
MAGEPARVCSQCQSSNPSDALFCDECGAPIEARCSRCGEANRHNAKFCKKCGNGLSANAHLESTLSLNTQNAPAESAGPATAPSQYLTSERKQVTVMFADIRDSTAFIEKLDPEDVRGHFDPVLQVMMEAVHRYGGTVNQVLGDGIMALFGAPVAHEDHAVRACYAALAMQEEMRRGGGKGVSASNPLRVGIGLNSGEVVVRSLANDLNFDYSALGQTTHLAARMQELARPGTILMTSACAREVEGFVQLQAVGQRQAKGVSRPLDVFELVGATAERTRLQVAARRGLTPFVGREHEIENFRRLTDKVANGGGHIFAMVGEAGMGKSRLVRELCDNHMPAGWRVVAASAISFGKATPYFPVIELLRRYFSVAEDDSREAIQAKVAHALRQLDGALSDVVAPILTLLDALPKATERGDAAQPNILAQWAEIVDEVAKFNNMEPPQRRRHTWDSVKRLLLRESQNQPLLVVFEDLHWIDSETQSVLDGLVESLPAGRILLLVNYRIGYKHDWIDKACYSQFRIDALSADGTDALLQSLIGRSEELRPLRKLLIERTDGNPFFAEEIVRALVEDGSLVGSKGAYKAGLKIDTIGIPATVRTVLADRIDRLPQDEKQLLQCAAAVGIVVPWRLLRAIADLPDEMLNRCMANLQRAEFVYESNLFPELEYSFTHALTNEVAYGALVRERRTALHRRIVRALEESAQEKIDDSVEALAHHAMRGELWEKAAAYQRRAGHKALSRSAFADALANYERAFEALGHLPPSRENQEMQIDLHLDCRNVLFLLGDLARVERHLQQAMILAEKVHDEQRTVRVLNFLNGYYGLVGDPKRAIEMGQRALSLGAVHADLELSAVVCYYTGVAYKQTGHHVQAVEMFESGINDISDELRFERFGTAAILSVTCRSHLVQSLAEVGRFSTGERWAESGIRTAEAANHAPSLVHILCSLGVLNLIKGDLERAIAILERSFYICQSAKIPVYFPMVLVRLGYAYANCGREGKEYVSSIKASANLHRRDE